MKLLLTPILAIYSLVIVSLVVFMCAAISCMLFFILITYLLFIKLMNKEDIPGWTEQFGTWIFNGLDKLADTIEFFFSIWKKMLKTWKDGSWL
jgi:hypothetical protein